MTASTDLVHHFAAAIAAARFEALPVAAVEAAKKSILDTVGVSLAASGLEPAMRAAAEIAQEAGGRPDCTFLAFGGRGPVVMAAFANGALAHGLDFDDQTPWGQHASSSIVPAVLAMAERQGGVSGKRLITAVAVGQDLFARLRCHVGWRKDWNLSTVLGVFAATAALAHLLDFDATRTAHALGIASMQCSGIMQMVAGTGSDLRGLYAGFSAKGAVMAALLAEKGITGIDALFQGQYGVFNTYFAGQYDLDGIMRGLGQDFLGGVTLYKAWPAVGTAHSHIHATIGLMTDHDLVPADLAEIRLLVGDYHALMCEPLAQRRVPATLADAKFSLPFLVGIAAARRDMRISDFTAAGLKDPAVLAAAALVVPVADSRLDWTLELPPGEVELITRDGRRLIRVGTQVPGSAEAPMGWPDLCRKFRDCAAAAVTPPSAAQLDAVERQVMTLDTQADGAAFMRALAV